MSAVLSVLRKLKQQAREALEERRPSLIEALKDIGDFYLELKWDFHSWGMHLSTTSEAQRGSGTEA